MTYRCSVCGKEYQSRSGLRRHVKGKHRVAVPALPMEEASEAPAGSEAAEPGAGPGELRAPVQMTPELVLALEALEVDVDDVLAYKVYHEPLKVVIIEGPVGYKRVWTGS